MSHKHHRRKIHKKGLPPGSLVYTGHRDNTPAKVVSIVYNEANFEEMEGYVP